MNLSDAGATPLRRRREQRRNAAAGQMPPRIADVTTHTVSKKGTSVLKAKRGGSLVSLSRFLPRRAISASRPPVLCRVRPSLLSPELFPEMALSLSSSRFVACSPPLEPSSIPPRTATDGLHYLMALYIWQTGTMAAPRPHATVPFLLVTALPDRLASLNHSSFKTLAPSFASRPWSRLLAVDAASWIVTRFLKRSAERLCASQTVTACRLIGALSFSQVAFSERNRRARIVFRTEFAQQHAPSSVDDQMKLLQQSWSDMLILDHVHQRLHNGLPDDTTLPNGQKFSLVSLALLGLPALADQLHALTARLQELRFDPVDYVCLKFLLLLNPDVRTLSNVRLVHEAQEQTKQVHLEYCLSNYPQISDKFGQLYQMLPSLKLISTRGEEYLFYKHMSGSAPSQTLLMEMLHAKKK
ncbi:hypothetical protein HPB51_002245 [Rhipicephalus microplus]|uniref:NR LBD domain-containing protein n=1 Tax=Rhipicephalus microplus TaxID=6941 RepID=A0A9J6EEV1_RHIMP|nr:hypothetical protein HPB51_002245 [Rhipicephalus microplus]